MPTTKVKLRSWNRFITIDFIVEPSLLGTDHTFTFENYKIKIKLPDSDKVNQGKDTDRGSIVSIVARRAVDNEPIEYGIYQVDVTVTFPVTTEIPSEVLNRNPNAYELLSDSEQKKLNNISSQHTLIAEKAFDYWIRVIRWKTDISSFGRYEVRDNHSRWSTYLYDIATDKIVWINPGIYYARRRTKITHDEWNDIQSALEKGLKPPIYYELKHDGEEYMKSGDFYRATVDLAVACETYLRFVVLNSLPSELDSSIITFIEEANISQFINKFFPSIIGENDKKQFKKMKSNLFKLFDVRNKVVHMGKMHRLTEESCSKFLEVTNDLFAIKPTSNLSKQE